mmetsp:Transcript_19425/g.58659  ORF Transcript_19425/g.58659 Transcript_19425/m.58659 type:complete len:129 (+) Transcript_19425:175-561(+)|eukprot:scaffold77334_cov26-Tisochrysis_lutea.AAC.4
MAMQWQWMPIVLDYCRHTPSRPATSAARPEFFHQRWVIGCLQESAIRHRCSFGGPDKGRWVAGHPAFCHYGYFGIPLPPLMANGFDSMPLSMAHALAKSSCSVFPSPPPLHSLYRPRPHTPHVGGGGS